MGDSDCRARKLRFTDSSFVLHPVRFHRPRQCSEIRLPTTPTILRSARSQRMAAAAPSPLSRASSFPIPHRSCRNYHSDLHDAPGSVSFGSGRIAVCPRQGGLPTDLRQEQIMLKQSVRKKVSEMSAVGGGFRFPTIPAKKNSNRNRRPANDRKFFSDHSCQSRTSDISDTSDISFN